MVWFQLVVSAKWTNKIALFFPAILWRSPRQWSTVRSVLEKLWKTVRLRAACLPFDRHAAGFDLGDAEWTRKNCFLLSSMSVWDIMHAFTPLGSATSGSYWFVAQLNPIAQQTAEWTLCRPCLHHPCLHRRTNLGAPDCILIRVIFWTLFRVPFLGTFLGPTTQTKSRRNFVSFSLARSKFLLLHCWNMQPAGVGRTGNFILHLPLKGWNSATRMQ